MSKLLRNFFRSRAIRMFGIGAALIGTLVIGSHVAGELSKTPAERAYERQVEMVMSEGEVDGRTIMVEYFDKSGTNHTLQVTIDGSYQLEDRVTGARILSEDTAEGFHQGMQERLGETIEERLRVLLRDKNPDPLQTASALDRVETTLRYAISATGQRVPITDLELSASIPLGDIAHDGLREIMTQETRFVIPQMPDGERIIARTSLSEVEREQKLTDGNRFARRALEDLAGRIDALVEQTRTAQPAGDYDLEFINDVVTQRFLERLEGMAEQIREDAAPAEGSTLQEQIVAATEAYEGHIEDLQKVIIGYKLSPEARRAMTEGPTTPTPGNGG
ncbi:MAG: hypothetical protein Alpg2KO_18490 [Alphaproteobacteria bacterium]